MRVNGFVLSLLGTCVLFGYGQQSFAVDPVKLDGTWNVQIMDKKRKVKAAMMITFSSRDANSCMSGDWKEVNVLSSKSEGEDFFPVNEPLAYSLDGNVLTIGRMGVCDGYLMLSGEVRGNMIQGSYSIVSIGGGSPLGYFNAKKNP